MSVLVVIAATLALAAQVENDPPIQVTARPWAPFISPMGEPFRAQSVADDPLARWFHQADVNRDGLLTSDEMQADARRFFVTLDGNRDGVIDSEEIVIYESDIAPEVQVSSRWKRAPQALAEARQDKPGDRRNRDRWRADENVDGYQLHGLQGAARYGLLNIPEPVAGADADFNRGTTLEEFQRAAFQRFQLLDSQGAGRLTLADLEPRLPTRPKAKRRVRRSREEPVDTRIGQPLPAKD